jgi:hypothetical protein
MSKNSSQKKNSITSSDEYDRLSDLYREAYDRVQSGGTGAGWSGIHYELMNVPGLAEFVEAFDAKFTGAA